MRAKVALLKEHKRGPRLRIKAGRKDQEGGDIILGKQADLAREPLVECEGPKGREILAITVFKLPPPG